MSTIKKGSKVTLFGNKLSGIVENIKTDIYTNLKGEIIKSVEIYSVRLSNFNDNRIAEYLIRDIDIK